MKIALIGYGKMGKEIERVAATRGITVGPRFTGSSNVHAKGLTKERLKGVDVCIDFSTPAACLDNIEAAAKSGTNIVVGTTGWYDKLPEVKKLVQAKKIGLLYSPNFSLGMNVFAQLVGAAAAYFNSFDMYDVAVREIHHRAKVDSPSGTALMLGQTILGEMKRKREILTTPPRGAIKGSQLQVTSERVGTVVGTHEILFDSEADSVTLVHAAKNRTGFALGALVAAEWLAGKRGCFTMTDVLEAL
jgi:4-hydroxy-tetrahydrodipicolinate reductase